MTAIAESNVSELVCVIRVTRGRCKAGCPVPLSVLLVSRTNAINCDHDDDSNTKFNLRRRRRRPTRVVLRHGDRFTAVIVAPPTEFVSKFTYLMKCFVGLPTRLLHKAGRVFKWRLKAVSVETAGCHINGMADSKYVPVTTFDNRISLLTNLVLCTSLLRGFFLSFFLRPSAVVSQRVYSSVLYKTDVMFHVKYQQLLQLSLTRERNL